MKRTAVACLAVLSLTACPEEKHEAAPVAPVAQPPPPPKPKALDTLSRSDFNFRAQERFLPLFWRTDANGNKALEPEELAVLWGPQNAARADYVSDKGFTAKFEEAWAALQKPADMSKLDPAEAKRQGALALELSQGRPTLVEYDVTQGSPQDKALVQHLTKASVLLETLYARQLGSLELLAKVPADDVTSRAVFYRNQGPHCVAPRTEKDPACTAIPGGVKRLSGLYPAEVQGDPKFCDALAKAKNAKKLTDHFSVVVADGKGFKAVPYSEAWKDDMEAVAKELDAAAAALASDDEKAFRTYLEAAAKGFRTNDWEPANAAWVAMGSTNSKWYLRIAPDEVYYEPCAWKAGFAVNFSRINPASLEWQKKLEPVKGDLEKALAALAGPPYKARAVKFKLPDFIDVVLNAGDQRHPHGAVIGQSLPNWGPTAAKGGRTVVMTNLYTDADSQAALKDQMASLFCAETMKKATTDAAPAVMSVVLHEAAHNLGPSHEYKVKGKEDDEVFGGPLASTMEELKAQTAALYFSEWLAAKGVIEKGLAEQAHVRDVAWGFGHVSRGMYDAAGKPKDYSHVASIQLGTLFKAGALTWKKNEKAGNGADAGCFELDFAKWTPAVDALAKRVLLAKGKGDKKDAEKMKADFVDADDEWKKVRETITERWLRAPKATFVYSVRE